MRRRQRTLNEALLRGELEFRTYAISAVHRLGILLVVMLPVGYFGCMVTQLMYSLPEILPGPPPIHQTRLVHRVVEPADLQFPHKHKPGRAEALEKRRRELEPPMSGGETRPSVPATKHNSR